MLFVDRKGGETSAEKQYVISPSSLLFQVWDATVTLSTFLSFIFTSYQAAFDSTSTQVLIITYFFDFIYILDIVARFQLAYNKDGSLVTDTRSIRKRYLTGKFVIDVISLLPLEILAPFMKGAHLSWYYRARLLRLNRCLRFYRVAAFFGAYEEKLGSNTRAIRSFKYGVIAYGLMHLISCGWFALACDNNAISSLCYNEGWAYQLVPDMMNSTTTEKYLKCLYWATITATSTGYGEIHAVNVYEKWYSVLSMLTGIGFFFGPILGDMASSMTNTDSKRARYTHRLNAIKNHLKDKQVSQDVQSKVKGYYEHLWVRKEGIDDRGIFDDLPLTFQAELSLNAKKFVLEKAPMFKDLSVGFMRMLSLVINHATYLPSEIISNRNDIGHMLFYIQRGEIEVLSGDNNKIPVEVLKEGSFFGEMSLVFNVPRSATIRAATFCDVLTLDRTDLTRVLKHFPTVGDQLYRVINGRCKKARTKLKENNFNPKKTKMKGEHVFISFRNQDQNNEQDTVMQNFQQELPQAPQLCATSIIMPNSSTAHIWNFMLVCVIFVMVLTQTFFTSFSMSFGRLGYGENIGMQLIFGFSYVFDLFLVIDIWMKLSTAVYTRDGTLIKESEEIRSAYIRTLAFWLDLFSVLPLEVFFIAKESTLDRWHLATFLKCNRLIKLYYVPRYFTILEKNIHLSISNVRAMKLFVYIIISTHLSACAWYLQACYGSSCASDSWAVVSGITNQTTAYESYITTMYWAAATMTSSGYGDITAHTSQGEMIVIVVLLVGLLLYGYCLSSIAATLANDLSPKVEFMERMNGVKMFMVDHSLSDELIERVSRYLGLVWRVHRGQAIPGAKKLMDDIPITLQQDVSFEEMKSILGQVPIFKNTDDNFLRILSSTATTYIFTPGDYIVYAGDVGREMYVIRRGFVEVLSKDGTYAVASLGPGCYFGEVGLIFGDNRTADVRATTYCEVVMLNKHDLDEVLSHFPLIAKQLNDTSHNIQIQRKIRNAAQEAGAKTETGDGVISTDKAPRKSLFNMSKVEPEMTPSEADQYEKLETEFQKPYDDLHPIFRLLSFALMKFTIAPNSLFFRVWNGLVAIIACIFCFTIGLQAAYLHDDQSVWIINYLLDAFFLIDLYLKFHVGHYTQGGILVSHPTATAKNYVKTNFLLDLVACFPIDLVLLAVGSHGSVSYARLNRLLHLYKVVQYFGYLEEPIGEAANLYREIKFAIYLFLMSHWFSCAWFMVACSEKLSHVDEYGLNVTIQLPSDIHHEHFKCGSQSWASKAGQIGSEPFYHQYIISLYWAVATTCSVGYGDIHANLVSEMVLALFCMIIGVVFYGYIIASVAASLANADAQRARYQGRLDGITQFLKEQEVEPHLKDRVMQYYKYIWLRNKGVDLENLFEGIPLALQADITLSLYKDIIEAVPLFTGHGVGFTKMLSLYIKPLLILRREYVVRKGDMGQEMYFIHSGLVDVVSEHEEPIIFDTMGAGRFFGEISIVFSCARTASIRAQTNCDAFVLTKEDLDEVLSHYPHIRKKIRETAEERQNMVKQRAAAFAAKKKEEEEQKKLEEEMKQSGNQDETDKDKKEEETKENEAKENEATDVEIVAVPTLREKAHALLNKLTSWSEFVINPDSKIHHIKEFNCGLIYVSYMITTYMAAYQHHSYVLLSIVYVCELCFIIEMYLNFHMAYYSESGELVEDRKKLINRYYKGKFKFDLFCSIPIDLIALAFEGGQRWQILTYLRTIHLFRLIRISQLYTVWLTQLNINVLMIRLSENLFQITIFVHTFACIWYGIACPGDKCQTDSWVEDKGSGPESAPEYQYADSIYWAVATMTSTGYGDIHATNLTEMVFASFVMIFGKLLFGFVLGNVASTLANIEAQRVKYEEKLSGIEAHMRDQYLSVSLQKRVMNFFEYIWAKNRGVDSKLLFYDMPSCMHGELYVAMIGDIIKSVPLFADCELPFIRLICTKARLVQFHSDEFIMRKGDIGHEMYIVKRGKVEAFNDSGETLRVYEAGEFLGEGNLIQTLPHSESVRAITHADMFVLSKNDIEIAMGFYEVEAEKIRARADASFAKT